MADRPRSLVLPVLLVLVIAIAALESMPLPALPLIQQELGLDPAQAGLLTTTLILTGSVSMPVVAKLGDIYGGRRVLLAVTWCIVAGGAVSAWAGSFQLMLLGQFLQGIGVGILPLTFVLARKLVPASRMPVIVGVTTAVYTIGGSIGVLGAGPIAETLSRQWMFLLPTLLVALMALVTPLVVRSDAGEGERAGRLDWPGAILLSGALVALMLGLAWVPQNGWLSLKSLGMLILVLVFGSAWAVVERRVPNPLISFSLLRTRGMWSSTVVAAVLGMGYSAAYFLIPQLIVLPPKAAGFGLGGTTSDISLYMAPAVGAALAIGPLSGYAVRRVGSRAVIVAGLLITALGALLAVWWHQQAWQIVLILLLTVGIGVGAAATALYTGALDSVDAADTGVATALNGVARAVGAAFGVQISAAIITSASDPATKLPHESGFQLGFGLSAVIILLALLAVHAVPGVAAQRPDTPQKADGAGETAPTAA